MMDDFSFPTVAIAVDEDPLASFPHFTTSPFWLLSSASSGQSTDSSARPRSLSSAGDQQLFEGGAEAMKMNIPKADSAGSSRRFVDEERMDMLWEDFNDETARKLSKKASLDSAGNSCRRRRSCKPEQCGSLIHRRRPSLIVMVKVLKKLLFIQKAAASSKRKQHHSAN